MAVAMMITEAIAKRREHLHQGCEAVTSAKRHGQSRIRFDASCSAFPSRIVSALMT